MDPTYFGAEQVTDEDRAYRGSRFSEVRDAIFANPYQKVWGGPGEPPFPVYEVTLPSVLRGALPLGPPYLFRQAVARAVDSKADLRWGADRKGFRRIIHPNGICLTGLWEISEQTPYSGYFRIGSRALTVCRYSTCCKQTRRGNERSLSRLGDRPGGRPRARRRRLRRQAVLAPRAGVAGSACRYCSSRRSFLVRPTSNPRSDSSTRLPNWENRTANRPERRLSCGCWSTPPSSGLPVTHWIFATKSWRKFTIEATPPPSAA